MTAEKVASVALLAGVLLLVTAQVVARYVFERPLFWSDELARYCYVWLSFIAAIAVTATRSHVRIDVINSFLGQGGRRFVECLASLIVIGTCAFMVYGSWDWLMTTARPTSPALRMPMIWLYVVVWAAFAAMGLHAIVNLWLFLVGREEPAEGAEVE